MPWTSYAHRIHPYISASPQEMNYISRLVFVYSAHSSVILFSHFAHTLCLSFPHLLILSASKSMKRCLKCQNIYIVACDLGAVYLAYNMLSVYLWCKTNRIAIYAFTCSTSHGIFWPHVFAFQFLFPANRWICVVSVVIVFARNIANMKTRKMGV